MKELPFTDDDHYKDDVIAASTNSGVPILVDFFTDWCGPCKLIDPLLREVHALGLVKVIKAKPEENESMLWWLAKHGHRITGLPTCVLVESGKPVRAIAGAFNEVKLYSFLKQSAAGLAQPGQLQLIPVPVEEASPHERWTQQAQQIRQRSRP